jgi:hypothetical protein
MSCTWAVHEHATNAHFGEVIQQPAAPLGFGCPLHAGVAPDDRGVAVVAVNAVQHNLDEHLRIVTVHLGLIRDLRIQFWTLLN